MKRGCALSLEYEYANPTLFFFLSFHLVLSVRTHSPGSIVLLRVGHRTRREGPSNSSPHARLQAACFEFSRLLENTRMPILQTLGRKLSGQHNQHLVEPRQLKSRKGGRRLTIENVPCLNNSRLLRLPREIRDAIWRYACLDTRIHWWLDTGKLKGQLCRSNREHCQLRCTAWIQKPGNPPFGKMGIMGLLLSCRSV
jgi:hypothetical protein